MTLKGVYFDIKMLLSALSIMIGMEFSKLTFRDEVYDALLMP